MGFIYEKATFINLATDIEAVSIVFVIAFDPRLDRARELCHSVILCDPHSRPAAWFAGTDRGHHQIMLRIVAAGIRLV